jgi:mRNA-degrading endonuclease HigB of HigAB toxin-antitoxin module
MELIKTHIRELLKRNLFVTEEKKKALQEKMEASSSEVSLKKLYDVLQNAENQQIELFKKVMKQNPHFLSDINHLIVGEKKSELRDKERVDRVAEVRQLESLETELDAIFS